MSKEKRWVVETHDNTTSFGVKVRKHIYSGRSEFQTLDILDTEAFGRVLLLDGLFMTTERDEFIYHEMIVHPAMFTHPAPEKVLIIGGGDGGTVREVLRHPTVKEVHLVEIDKLVVDKSIEFLPTISCALGDEKVSIFYEDGIKWAKDHRGQYDVIITDSTDPIGPAEGLFAESFYTDCKRALRPGGVFAAQTESAYLDQDKIRPIAKNLGAAFGDNLDFYTATIPTYPGGLWCFAIATEGRSPREAPDQARLAPIQNDLQVYNADLHQGAFGLPNFLKRLLAEAMSGQ